MSPSARDEARARSAIRSGAAAKIHARAAWAAVRRQAEMYARTRPAARSARTSTTASSGRRRPAGSASRSGSTRARSCRGFDTGDTRLGDRTGGAAAERSKVGLPARRQKRVIEGLAGARRRARVAASVLAWQGTWSGSGGGESRRPAGRARAAAGNRLQRAIEPTPPNADADPDARGSRRDPGPGRDSRGCNAAVEAGRRGGAEAQAHAEAEGRAGEAGG